MENAHVSAESLRQVDSLVQKIDGLCKSIEQSLALCMEINSESVGSYSTSTAGQISSDFVDKVILTIQKIKNHLRDLKKAMPKAFIRDMRDVENIVASLNETSQTLQGFLLENNFFYNTFQLPIMEIQATIDQILETVEVVQYA